MGVQIGGLWVNTNDNGEKVLSGNFGGFARIRVIKNRWKEKDAEPDYLMYVDKKTKGKVEPEEVDL